MLVIDASIAFKWIVPEPDSEAADALIAGGETLIAPDLIRTEVANAGWKATRRGDMTAEQLRLSIEWLPQLLDQLHTVAPLLARAVAIACRLDHPVYDCVYLALAERVSSPLVTVDERLCRRVADTPWSTLVRRLDRSVPMS
jgi:predicted nucleic acid-binding protein